MLQNEYLVAIVTVDPAENELSKDLLPGRMVTSRQRHADFTRPRSRYGFALLARGAHGAAAGALEEAAAKLSILSEARSRLDRRRFSRPNTHFAAFFKIYKKIIFSRANFANFCKKIENFAMFL